MPPGGMLFWLNTDGYTTGRSLVGSGSRMLPKNCMSSLGSTAFHLSFLPSGISTSLTSGMPSRLTWTHSPE